MDPEDGDDSTIHLDADLPLDTPRTKQSQSQPQRNFGGGAAGVEDGEENLSPLEQEVLEEYARLVGNLDDVSTPLSRERRPKGACVTEGSTFLPCSGSGVVYERIGLICEIFVVERHPGGIGEQAVSGNSGCFEGVGEEDDDGVYVAEGECLFDCVAAGDG